MVARFGFSSEIKDWIIKNKRVDIDGITKQFLLNTKKNKNLFH